MEVINEFTGMKISNRIIRFVVNVVNNIVIFGYTNSDRSLKQGEFFTKDSQFQSLFDPNKLHLEWSPYLQKYYYISDNTNCNIENISRIKNGLKPGQYKYSFERKYEAVQNFKLFDNKQVKLNLEHFPISDHVTRSIGIEFESSLGYISEQDCFDYGLIPLRDGSISGIEYSTVILKGNEGFNLLKKQLELLSSYTHFNKECSLHIHFGDFPLDAEKIYNLYTILYSLQDEIVNYVPDWTFYTEQYKANGKSYCKPLKRYKHFTEMFRDIAGQEFFGNFMQPHPADPTRNHKWNIISRYYWCNFVNLLCYNVNKTVEFRFLRPTYNLEKILTWIYILNGILNYAEQYKWISGIDLRYILEMVYPQDIADMLYEQLIKLKMLHESQTNNGDYIGADLILENRFFNSNKII